LHTQWTALLVKQNHTYEVDRLV